MQRQITLEQILDATIEAYNRGVYRVMPGAVVSYNATTQQAYVQPMTNDVRLSVGDGTNRPYGETWPVMPDVPVLWPRFGPFMLCGPLAQGNSVLLLAFDRDPHPWLQQGAQNPGSVQPVNPWDLEANGGSYWIAIPLNIFGPISDAAAAAGAMLVGVDDDQAQIRVTPGSVQLGATGGDFLALASKVLTQLGNIVTAFNSHTHPYVNGTTPSTTSVPSSPMSAPSPVASSLVKAQ